MKYTFLSKWTVLILTLITAGAVYWGYILIVASDLAYPWWGTLVLLGGALVYTVAWIIALFDSIQERKFGWSLGLLALLTFWVGPIVYSLFGPRNRR
jgi:hypothetical protein